MPGMPPSHSAGRDHGSSWSSGLELKQPVVASRPDRRRAVKISRIIIKKCESLAQNFDYFAFGKTVHICARKYVGNGERSVDVDYLYFGGDFGVFDQADLHA